MTALKKPINRILISLFASLLIAHPASAMNLSTYGLDSLVFFSTDIVIVTLADSDKNPHPKEKTPAATAIVEKPLFGTLHTGDKIPGLSPYLGFFYPTLNAGQKVILFLDNHPREEAFMGPSSQDSPYAILPGGIFLINAKERIHRYYQINNPGPYVAEAYASPMEIAMRAEADNKEQRKKQRDALPILIKTEQQISNAVQEVISLHKLLDRKPQSTDAQPLLALLQSRYNKYYDAQDSNLGDDAINDQVVLQIVKLRDKNLLLNAYPWIVSHDSRYTIENAILYNPTQEPPPTLEEIARNENEGMTYLINALETEENGVAMRLSAAHIIYNLSLPSNQDSDYVFSDDLKKNDTTSIYADHIHAIAAKIFSDEHQDSRLRIACLPLLNLKQVKMQTNVAKIYATTSAIDVKFAIEEAFLDINDATYAKLHAPSGPVASLIRTQPESPVRKKSDKTRFWVKYHETEAFNKQFFKDFDASNEGKQVNIAESYFNLTEEKTNIMHHFEPQQLWSGGVDGENYIEFTIPSNLNVGRYILSYEYSKNGHVISRGYPLRFEVVATDAGNMIRQ